MQVTSGAGPPAPASLEAAALTLLEVAWALEYLHHMHIVHRDLKPTNVLLASSPVCTPRTEAVQSGSAAHPVWAL